MIELKVGPGQRILELGCGETPHPQTHVRVDTRPIEGVTDFIADFEQSLPIADNDFEGLYCGYTLEHLSYPNIPAFLAECYRIVKPGSKVVFTTPNTEAQLKWIWEHHDGWDGKDTFTSCSELLFGSQNYAANTHKAFFNPGILTALFWAAGFEQVKVHPYGARETDLCVEAVKPNTGLSPLVKVREHLDTLEAMDKARYESLVGMELLRDQPTTSGQPQEPAVGDEAPHITESTIVPPTAPAAELFDRAYFNGGGKVGGYAREGLWDYPVHNITAAHVLARRPQSVLELGCARGYIGKRIQDAGIPWAGLEVSKHCWLTRVADGIFSLDLGQTPWPLAVECYDLCFSIATLEHVPEAVLPAVIKEMARTCERGLHGIDFGHKDDGFDKTHVSLHPREWWLQKFAEYAPDWPVEILDKEDLERGGMPPEVLAGDGKVKLNVGSFTTMFHYGWDNLDNHDLRGFAQQHSYRFGSCDVRQGLPYATGVVDLIFLSHSLDQLTYAEGLSFLRECRRVLKPDGALRIVGADARLLLDSWHDESLERFDEVSGELTESSTSLRKLWSLLLGGHVAAYDTETLHALLAESGFLSYRASFRHATNHPGAQQILRETLDTLPCLSFFTDCLPLLQS